MDPSEPRLVPVIDILDGVVVRGVRGRRDLYRPLTSRWTSSTAPLEVANALRTHYGLRTLYVAMYPGFLRATPLTTAAGPFARRWNWCVL